MSPSCIAFTDLARLSGDIHQRPRHVGASAGRARLRTTPQASRCTPADPYQRAKNTPARPSMPRPRHDAGYWTLGPRSCVLMVRCCGASAVHTVTRSAAPLRSPASPEVRRGRSRAAGERTARPLVLHMPAPRRTSCGALRRNAPHLAEWGFVHPFSRRREKGERNPRASRRSSRCPEAVIPRRPRRSPPPSALYATRGRRWSGGPTRRRETGAGRRSTRRPTR